MVQILFVFFNNSNNQSNNNTNFAINRIHGIKYANSSASHTVFKMRTVQQVIQLKEEADFLESNLPKFVNATQNSPPSLIQLKEQLFSNRGQ